VSKMVSFFAVSCEWRALLVSDKAEAISCGGLFAGRQEEPTSLERYARLTAVKVCLKQVCACRGIEWLHPVQWRGITEDISATKICLARSSTE